MQVRKKNQTLENIKYFLRKWTEALIFNEYSYEKMMNLVVKLHKKLNDAGNYIRLLKRLSYSKKYRNKFFGDDLGF